MMLHNPPSRLAMGAKPAVRSPRRFRAAEGVLTATALTHGPFRGTPKGRTAAQRAGLRYESKVHDYLASQFGDAYVPSQWFQYIDADGTKRHCQTDGLLRVGSLACIFEIKLRFTPDAWWQLRRLYSSVVLAAWKPRTLGCCVITRSYDPATPFPEAHELINGIAIENWVIRRQFAQVAVAQLKL